MGHWAGSKRGGAGCFIAGTSWNVFGRQDAELEAGEVRLQEGAGAAPVAAAASNRAFRVITLAM
jgi:hypothetical protein